VEKQLLARLLQVFVLQPHSPLSLTRLTPSLASQLLRAAMSLCTRQHKVADEEGVKRMWFSVLDVFLVPQRLLKEEGSRYSTPPFPIVKMAQCIFQSTSVPCF
jgi:hypothetical protein